MGILIAISAMQIVLIFVTWIVLYFAFKHYEIKLFGGNKNTEKKKSVIHITDEYEEKLASKMED